MRTAVTLAIAISLALAMGAGSASAASTRAEYVAQVDPICQSADAQEAALFQPVLRATKRSMKKHSSRKTLRRFKRLYSTYLTQKAAIEHAANTQIAAVPPAPDDVSLVQVWLRARNELVDIETGLVGAIRKNPIRGITSFIKLVGLQQETYDLVRDFGFRYCNASPPEFAFAVGADIFPK